MTRGYLCADPATSLQAYQGSWSDTDLGKLEECREHIGAEPMHCGRPHILRPMQKHLQRCLTAARLQLDSIERLSGTDPAYGISASPPIKAP